MTEGEPSFTMDWSRHWHEGEPGPGSWQAERKEYDELLKSTVDAEPFERIAKETGCHAELKQSSASSNFRKCFAGGFDVFHHSTLSITGAAASIAVFILKMRSTIKAVLESKKATIEFTVGKTKLKYKGPMAEEEAAAICERIIAIAEEAARKTQTDNRGTIDDTVPPPKTAKDKGESDDTVPPRRTRKKKATDEGKD